MILLCVGVNHKNTPVVVRENLAIIDHNLTHAIQTLQEYVKSGFIVSTCNRTEIYALVGHEKSGTGSIVRFLSEYNAYPETNFMGYVYVHSQREAAKHLFRVSAGLDSMILGENQILGQLKSANQAALSTKAIDPVLIRLFNQALKVGKAVRQNTKINDNDPSISSVAVDLANRQLKSLNESSVLVIGSGEVGKETGKALVNRFDCKPIVTSRTYDKACQLANILGGTAIPITSLPEALTTVDMIISSTASEKFVLKYDMVHNAMKLRSGKPLIVIDTAVPRDVDPKVGELPNVSLFDIDRINDGSAGRFNNGSGDMRTYRLGQQLSEMRKAEDIADMEANKFIRWWNMLEVVPTIKQLRNRADAIKSTELKKALGKLNKLSSKDIEILDHLTEAIITKILHQPLVQLKKDPDAHSYLRIIRKLFQMDNSDDVNSAY